MSNSKILAILFKLQLTFSAIKRGHRYGITRGAQGILGPPVVGTEVCVRKTTYVNEKHRLVLGLVRVKRDMM